MRHCTLRLVSASLALAAAVLGPSPAAAEDAFRHGHIRQVEPGVTLQRATETSAEEAIRNLPFLPGDRVWTDAAGRTEFQFPEGTVVRLDSRSKLDYADHDESSEERVVLRLWSGSLILRTRSRESAIFDIETPGGLVQVAVPAVVRVDVEGGEVQLSVYEGEASLDTGRDLVHAAAGERTWASWGGSPAEPEPFDRYAGDGFARWDADLESQEAWAANSSRYLPSELATYAPEFDNHGTWVYEQPVGYVWQPRVVSGWAPYTNGRWTWTSFGWTWVPYEPWGWAPHHYGRWGFSASLGWYWAPGTVWSGGWVSWGVGGGYVGWCALGPWNRPVVSWPHHRRHYRRHHGGHAVPRGGSIGPGGGRPDHAVPRGSLGTDRAWTVVKRDDLGRGDIARRRVDPTGVGALRVADSVSERPNRTATALSRTAAVPSAARGRPRPGSASRAARGASPVPMGSAALGLSSGTGASPSGGIGAAAARARSRAGSRATALPPNPGTGAASGSAASPGAARRARPRAGASAARGSSASRGSEATPWVGSSRSRGGASARPRSSSGSRANPIGSLFPSRERSGSASRARPSGRSGSTRPVAPGSVSRGTTSSPSRGGTVTTRPRSSPRRELSSRPSGSSSRSRGSSVRPRSSGSRGGSVSSRPSGSSSRSRGSSVRPRSSGSRSGGVSSRPRSSGSRGGLSSRPSSRGGGVSSRSRSGGSRSGGAARSRPRSRQ